VTPSLNFSFTQMAMGLQVYPSAWLRTGAKRPYVAFSNQDHKVTKHGEEKCHLSL
jgi:hypothetical protein